MSPAVQLTERSVLPEPGSHPTISLCLGIIRSWGASHPARIHIRFTSRFAQRLCEGLHRFPEAAAILEHIGHLRVPDRTLSVSRHVRFITLCGRTMHRDRIPTSHWQCPDPTPSPRHVYDMSVLHVREHHALTSVHTRRARRAAQGHRPPRIQRSGVCEWRRQNGAVHTPPVAPRTLVQTPPHAHGDTCTRRHARRRATEKV